jgi:AraC family transcriptional regulator of adaptative response / DNA-3-methyladenine glycosylase II
MIGRMGVGRETGMELEVDRTFTTGLVNDSVRFPEAGPAGKSLDPRACWQAIHSRDARFDGQFFAGTVSTRVYCRNVCPVPFARAANLVLFVSVDAAELAGFSPCKRCRPQAAPGSPAWRGSHAIVIRVLRRILDGALNGASIEKLAARSGLGSRQLRRLFVQHLGTSPLKIASAHRTQLALTLIADSKVPMSQIAFGSGFQSIREFNHAIRMSTGHSPTELRTDRGISQSFSHRCSLELRLSYIPPFDWGSLIEFMGQRAIPGVEFVTQGSYQRTIDNGGVPGRVEVLHDPGGTCLVVKVEMGNLELLGHAVERIRCMFDLNADPRQIASHLSRDAKLRDLLRQRPGLRVPGSWDGFESAILAILGDGLTAPARKGPVARIVRMFGAHLESPIREMTYLFPRPEVLAVADLSKIGINDACAGAIRRLSLAAVQGNVSFASPRTIEETVMQLKNVCGMNESMAQYVAMRAFGYPDAFPSHEAGLKRSLAAGGRQVSSTDALAMAEHWQPWRAYAAMYLSRPTALGQIGSINVQACRL